MRFPTEGRHVAPAGMTPRRRKHAELWWVKVSFVEQHGWCNILRMIFLRRGQEKGTFITYREKQRAVRFRVVQGIRQVGTRRPHHSCDCVSLNGEYSMSRGSKEGLDPAACSWEM